MPRKSKRISVLALYRKNPYLLRLYREHLRRLKKTCAKTDNKPGKLDVAETMKLGSLFRNLDSFTQIYNFNIQILKLLNEIKTNVKKSLLEAKLRKKHALVLKTAPNAHARAIKLRKDNLEIARRLKEIKYRNHQIDAKLKAKTLKCQIGKFKLPEKILLKYKNKIELPQDPCLQYKLLRPNIYIELDAKAERSIGRITFQLYTESCPMIVLEIIKTFMKKENRKLKISRVYPHFWAECELSIDNKNFIYPNELEYDMRALDHESGIGIVSLDMRRSNLNLLRYGLLVLTLTFKPIAVLNGRNVAIGRIIDGRRNLLGLSEYGTKNGKPLKDIIVTQIGCIDSKNEEQKK